MSSGERPRASGGSAASAETACCSLSAAAWRRSSAQRLGQAEARAAAQSGAAAAPANACGSGGCEAGVTLRPLHGRPGAGRGVSAAGQVGVLSSSRLDQPEGILGVEVVGPLVRNLREAGGALGPLDPLAPALLHEAGGEDPVHRLLPLCKLQLRDGGSCGEKRKVGRKRGVVFTARRWAGPQRAGAEAERRRGAWRRRVPRLVEDGADHVEAVGVEGGELREDALREGGESGVPDGVEGPGARLGAREGCWR